MYVCGILQLHLGKITQIARGRDNVFYFKNDVLGDKGQTAHEQIDMKSSYVFGNTVAFVVSYQAAFAFQAGRCCRSKGEREDLGKMGASDGPQESGRN